MEAKDSGLLQAQQSNSVTVVVQKAPVVSPLFSEAIIGSTYREIFNSHKGLSEQHTQIYDRGVLVEDWDVTITESSYISVCQIPQGTVLVAALVSALVGAVIGYLMFEEPPEVPENEKRRRVQGDKNGNKGYEPLPFILGKRKVVPAYAAKPYTEYVGKDQYYNMLLHIGYGPLSIDDIRIGSVPIDSFDDVDYAYVDWYQNSDTNALQDIWSKSVNQNSVNQEVPREDDFLTTTIPIGKGKTTVVISYPQGLRWIAGSGPKHLCGSVQFQYQASNGDWLTPIRYNTHKSGINKGYVPYRISKRDDGTFTRWGSSSQNWGDGGANILRGETVPSSYIVYDNDNGFAVIQAPDSYYVGNIFAWDNTASEFTKSFNFNQNLHGSPSTDDPVPFRIRNLSPGDTSSKPWTDRVDLLTVSRSAPIEAGDFDDAIGSPDGDVRQAVLAIRIRASDQISGTLDDVNVIAESVVPSSFNEDWRFWYTNNLSLKTTRNPAELYKWLLQGPMNPVRVGNTRIDLDAISDWVSTCTSEGWETSSLVNYEATLKESLSNVAKTGRAQFSMKNGKFSVVENIERTIPEQVFTNKNSRDFSSKRVFPDPSDGITVEFQNENEDFEVDEYTYIDPSIDPADYVFQTESLELWGVSKPVLAQKHARFAFLEKRLRREVYSLTTDIENLSCRRGSFVKVAHNIIDVGIGQGFIGEVDGSEFTIDETIGLTVGSAYGVTVRSVNAGTNVETIEATYEGGGVWTTTDTINFVAGDLAAYGEIGNETLDCLVTEISYDNDFEATLKLVNAANEIYTSDDESLPEYETALTPRVDYFAPAAPTITVDDGISGYNNPVIKVTVSDSERVESNITAFKLQYRTNDEVYEPIDEDDPGTGDPVDSEDSLVWVDVDIRPASDPVFYVPITQETGNVFYFRAKAYGGGSLVSDWSDEYEVIVSEKPAQDVDDFTITEQINTPKTPDGAFSTLVVEVTPPDDIAYSHSIAEYRVPSIVAEDPDNEWFFISRIGWNNVNKAEVVVPATGVEYQVRVRSVSIWGVTNKNGITKSVITTNVLDPEYTEDNPSEVLPVPNVRGLELFEQGNDTEFGGKDAKFVWRRSSVGDYVELGYEGLRGASASRLDQYFRDYEVEIWADNEQVRIENVYDPIYVYTFEKNAEDYERVNGEVGAWREFQIRVIERGRNNQQSEKQAKLTVTNTAPKALNNLVVNPGFNVIEISYKRPTDLDFAGVDIWVEETQGFDPDATEPFATISDNSFVASGLEQGTTYYVRLRPFDEFGRTSTNTTSEISITTKTGVDLTGLSGWAYELDPADEDFINENLAGDAVPSEKIKNLTAAKITAGVINATETITSQGLIRAVDDINTPQYQTGIGPTEIDGTTYLMWGYDEGAVSGEKLQFGIDELGNAYFRGTLEASSFTNDALTIDTAGNLTSTGTFRFGGSTDEYVEFDGTNLTIETPEFSLSGGNATFSGDLVAASGTFAGELQAATGVLGDPSGNRVEYDGTSLIVQTPELEIDGAGSATFSGLVSAAEVSGSTVTGGIIRTNSGDTRVELNETENTLSAYISGSLLFELGPDGLTFSTSLSESLLPFYGVRARGTVGVSGSGISTGVSGLANRGGVGVSGFAETGDGDIGRGVLGEADGTDSRAVEGNCFSVNGYDFYASGDGVNYGPFTGSHDGLLDINDEPDVGDILCASEVNWKRGISQTIHKLDISGPANQKSSFGVFVYSSEMTWEMRPTSLQKITQEDFSALKEKYKACVVNSLGEGQINVCSESGDFEVGDLICTSNTPGKGMRYDGQDMRYVVAKCMESVKWDEEDSDVKMVACIYLCG